MNDWPEWLKVGAKVAQMELGNNDNVQIRSVERFTKTQCVLDDGSRYRQNNVDADGMPKLWTGGTWGRSYALFQLNHPTVIAARKRVRSRNTAAKVYALMDQLRKYPDDLTHAKAAVEVLQELITKQENR